MMKILTLLLTSFWCKAQQLDAQDVFGKTPLHYTAMLPSEIVGVVPQEINWSELNKQRAAKAAILIWAGADITIKDSATWTPYDYAYKNRDRLPQVFQVHIVAKIKATFDKSPVTLEQQRILNSVDAYLDNYKNYVKIASKDSSAQMFLRMIELVKK